MDIHKSNDVRTIFFEEHIFIYAPNSPAECKSFFMKINTWVTKHSFEPDNIIIAGGCNCNFKKTYDHSVKKFQNIFKDNNLIV